MNTTETQVFQAAQDARQAAHVSFLSESPALDTSARLWAETLRSEQTISHYRSDGSTPESRMLQVGEWSYILENVGLFAGGSDESRHNRAVAAFVSTMYPDHLAQTINPNVTMIGVSVIDGYWNDWPATWAVVDLAAPAPVPDSTNLAVLFLSCAFLLN